MSNRITLIAILVLVLFTTNIQAQNPAAAAGSTSSVTGSVTPEGIVRMIAHGETLQIRMEVYSATGEVVSDSGLRQGNIVDWKQSDATQPMTDGSYLVVVTVKDFKGNLTQRTAALSLQAGQLNLQKREEMTTAQAQMIQSRQSQKTKRMKATTQSPFSAKEKSAQ
jgi:hypothetical protein